MLAIAEAGAILAIASLLISAALILSRKKPKLANNDDALTSVATLGAYAPLVIGRARTGPIFLTVPVPLGSLDSGQQQIGGNDFAKGLGGPPAPTQYHESCIHALCVGPGSRLDGIYQNGERIWQGPITPQSHPSGSQITIIHEGVNEGIFEIHWGFPDDPLLLVGGVNHRFALVMKIKWVDKNLGTSRQWPRLEYEVVCPCYSEIAHSPVEMILEGNDVLPTFETAGYAPLGNYLITDRLEFNIYGFNSNRTLMLVDVFEFGFPIGSGSVAQAANFIQMFPVGGMIKIWTPNINQAATSGNNAPVNGYGSALGSVATNGAWRYYWIAGAVLVNIPTQVNFLIRNVGTYSNQYVALQLGAEVDPQFLKNVSNIAPKNPGGGLTSGETNNGIGAVQIVTTENSDGINPICMIDQLLFSKFPYGAGRDRLLMDETSIEYAAQQINFEKIRGGIVVRDGEGIESVLAALLQDLGLMIPWDPEIGRYLFRVIRYEDGPVDLPASVVIKNPTMEAVQGQRPIDVTAFTYSDRARNWREVVLKAIDSGQLAEYESPRAAKVRVEVTQDRDSITRIIPRRQQEALANQATLNWETNHATRTAVPGSRFSSTEVEGPALQFLITEVKRDINTNKNDIGTLLDVYDQPLPEPEDMQGLDDPLPEMPEIVPLSQVEEFQGFELPKSMLKRTGKDIEIVFLFSRTDKRIISATIWGSKDGGSSFSAIGYGVLAARGQLTAQMPVSSINDIVSQIGFTALDVNDLDLVEDLASDESSWRGGRQVLLIGNEVIFLREADVTAIGPVAGVLKGLIRGRAGTTPQVHAIGTPFWILLAKNLIPITSELFLAEEEFSYKAQAQSIRGTVNIAEQEPNDMTIVGKAFKPPVPNALRQASMLPTYVTGVANVTVVWGYGSTVFPRTGLGMQPLGTQVTGSPAQGTFFIDVLNNTSTVIHSDKTAVPSYTLPLALRTSLGLDALSQWTIRVRHMEGAYTSEFSSLTLKAV